MLYSRSLFSVINFSLILLTQGNTAAAHPEVSSALDPVYELRHSRKGQVVEWFKKYDEIRRDAEMSLADKFQAMLLATGSPGKRNVTVASHMAVKYSVALAEIKRLEPIPETKELQEGYTEYFSRAYKLLQDELNGQELKPLNDKNFLEVKHQLERLDGKNKKLDDQLRKEYGIPKHRHS